MKSENPLPPSPSALLHQRVSDFHEDVPPNSELPPYLQEIVNRKPNQFELNSQATFFWLQFL